jgi:imidazolonepropionase-like amidohydrolase
VILSRERSQLGKVARKAVLLTALSCSLSVHVSAQEEPEVAHVLLAKKALICGADGRETINNAAVIFRDGKIEAVGRQGELELPLGAVIHDLGDSWVMPGMIDLHSHIAGSGYNDMIYQCNPGLRASVSVTPQNERLNMGMLGGVTTILFIPGSGTNIGGQGVLMKTGPGDFEDLVIRDPGSMKVAQGDNPKRWGYGMQRTMMNHHIRVTLRKGKAYAKRWEAFERGDGERPERHLHLDIFRDLEAKRTQISTHTQYYQVVLASLNILKGEFGFDAYIDHGSFDSWPLGQIAEEMGVAAILGPREVLFPRAATYPKDGRVEGSAWGFQKEGHSMIGFNTDAPVVPQEELPLQSAMGVRYGFDNSEFDAVRGVTIVPAQVAAIDHRVGSLMAGKDADLLVVTGDPSDPRSAVEMVWIDGVLASDVRGSYGSDREAVRRW